eukprot:CAMPEP_0184523564 /NCGR_PEP_ID=MMETSP0198_2-20121128/8959_1 /TAXON_ID=1112570 /ORGANISM="Thraustochytrium sp., Strain LLF1b" /LENGTH=62 /DNA_ID=CAMNT_0026914619 /DNA_START=208 /DNA_END=396 /DNA_ORIENTATION=-
MAFSIKPRNVAAWAAAGAVFAAWTLYDRQQSAKPEAFSAEEMAEWNNRIKADKTKVQATEKP